MMRRSTYMQFFTMLVAPALAPACAAPDEAPRVRMPVTIDASAIEAVTTDLGYDVEINSARVIVSDLVFTVAGEVHTTSRRRALSDFFIPSAHAHPGHYQGGEVTGELRGAFAVNWVEEDGRTLGPATMIATTYRAANFTFGRGSRDTLPPQDPLIEHTALVSGVATKGGDTTAFTIIVDAPRGRQLVGAPAEFSVDDNDAGALLLRLHTADPLEGDTMFDGLDFTTLDADGDGALRIAPDLPEVEDAYNTFRRVFLTHDHYSVQHQES